MLGIILVVIAAVIVIVLVIAAMRPNTFRVQRSAVMQAPAQKIAGLIDDFHAWAAWSPYEKLDPNMRKTMSGAARGRGAVYEWSGNNKAGAGRMEILEADAAKVVMKLDFMKPFEAHNTAEFRLMPQGSATEVAWAIHGPSPFMHKLMGMFINMDRMIGKDFEEGLANLKALAEK
jgi:hypothetical protein